MNYYFGEKRDAPVWDGLEKTEVPCGEECMWCQEEIAPEDSGIVQGLHISHSECYIRSGIGGANHLLRLCTCCGGTEPPDPEGMSYREASLLAVAIVDFYTKLGHIPPCWRSKDEVL